MLEVENAEATGRESRESRCRYAGRQMMSGADYLHFEVLRVNKAWLDLGGLCCRFHRCLRVSDTAYTYTIPLKVNEYRP